MPIPQPLYINGPSLSSATAVFSDPLMSICAPDGYYSDGIVVRQQVGCSLLPEEPCGNCGFDCSVSTGFHSEPVISRVNVNLGSDTGAVVIRLTPNGYPTAAIASFNGNTYNKFSSPVDGYHAAPSGLQTIVGNSDDDCGVLSTPFLLDNYEYDGSTFIPTGTSETVFFIPSQLSLSSSINPMGCCMVIPKITASPSLLSLSLYSPCYTDFSVEVNCPIKLRNIFSTASFEGDEPCGLPTDQVYYSVPVNGDGVTLGLYDWMFYDTNGSTILSDGWYLSPIHCPTPNDSFHVVNGVITEFDSFCKSGTILNYEIANNSSGCVSGGISSANLTVDWQPLGVNIVDVYADDIGSVSIYNGVYTAKLRVEYLSPSTGCPDMLISLKLDGIVVAFTIVSPTSGGIYEISYTFSANTLTTYSILAEITNSY